MADPNTTNAPNLLNDEVNSAEHAAQLLRAPNALHQLTMEEARVVVAYMTPQFIPEGTTFIREGDAGDGGFMVLVLGGEVVVESFTVSTTEPLTVTVLGPGSLLGEVGLVDNGPRSASCVADTDVNIAMLTRVALQTLIAQNPLVGARLLLTVSAVLAERLRDYDRKLRLYAKLAMAMHEEIEEFTRQDGASLR
jgi:CRP-like cAMP-binding protein